MISNQSKIDMSLVVKSSQTKYTREDLLRLKQRMNSCSPEKSTIVESKPIFKPNQSHLDIIKGSKSKESGMNVKRVSFNEN